MKSKPFFLYRENILFECQFIIVNKVNYIKLLYDQLYIYYIDHQANLCDTQPPILMQEFMYVYTLLNYTKYIMLMWYKFSLNEQKPTQAQRTPHRSSICAEIFSFISQLLYIIVCIYVYGTYLSNNSFIHPKYLRAHICSFTPSSENLQMV